jgi:penicillin amidase
MEIIYGEPKKFAIGATMPGLPFIISGRNNYAAWTVTLSYQDCTDLYQETLSEDESKYLYEGNWRDIKVLRYTINKLSIYFLKIKRSERVKIAREDKEHEFEVKATHHGPII